MQQVTLTLPIRPKPGTVAGKRRKATGDAAEARVEAMNAACKLAGVAELHKIPTDVVVQRNGPRIVGAFHRKRATVDCLGWMLDGTGRAVAVEVKSLNLTRRGRFPLSDLEPHQRAALASAHAAGAVAVLLVVSGPSVYAVPWVNVAVAIEYGEASLAMVPGWLARGVYLAPWAAKRKAG